MEAINDALLPNVVFGKSAIPVQVTSDNTGEPKFFYLANYRTAANAELLLADNMKQRPGPDSSVVFDFKDRIFSSLDYDDNIFGTSYSQPTKSVGQYHIAIGSRFAGSLATQPVIYNGTNGVGAPALLSKEFTVLKGPNYFTDLNTVKAIPTFLTDLPSTIEIDANERYDHYITFIGASAVISINSINNDGSTTNLVAENRTLNNRPGILGVGINQIRARVVDPVAFDTGIASGYKGYTVTITIGEETKTFTYTLDRRVKDFDTVAFTFINRFGYWDTMEMLGAPTVIRSNRVDRSNVNVNTVANNTFTNLIPNNHGRTVHAQPGLTNSIQFSNGMVARSAFHDRETANWLLDIPSSPDVRVQEGTTYLPVVIGTTASNINQSPLEGQYELELNYNYAQFNN